MQGSRFNCLRTLPLCLLALILAVLPASTHGQVAFSQPTVIPTFGPLHPSLIAASDVNGDGNVDLIFTLRIPPQTTTNLFVIFGDGHGGFRIGPESTFQGPSFAIGDFINVGKPQLVDVHTLLQPTGHPCAYTLFASLLTPASNNGADSSQLCASGTQLPTPDHLVSGKLQTGSPAEFIFTDAANKLLYVGTLQGLSNADTVLTLHNFPLIDGPGAITVVDLNGDGNMDVVVNGQTGLAADIYLGDGTGALTYKGRFTGSGQIHSLLLQDVNQDGRPDLIAEGPAGRIDVYPGNGDGTFSSTSIGGTGTLNGTTGNGGYLIALADLNHDGQLDALTSTPAGISVLIGQGTQYLGLKGIFNAGPGRTSFATADFNGDGNLDLAVDSPEGIAILFGNPDGTFQTSQAFAAGKPAMSGAVAQFTASGQLDAVVSTGPTAAQLLLGSGDGTFTPVGGDSSPRPTSPGAGPPSFWSAVAPGDFNGDGLQDLLFTVDGPNATLPGNGGLTGASVQINLGNGVFFPPNQVLFSSSQCPATPAQLYGHSVVADLNGDGISDFANRGASLEQTFLGSTSLTGKGIGIPFTTGSGFPDPQCTPHAHNLLATADFNNDGLPDLLEQQDGHLLLQLNTGGSHFTQLGDLATDGSLTTPGQLTAPNIAPTFGGTSTTFGFPAFPGQFATADLDQDGNQDLLVTYANLQADRTTPVASAPNYLYLWFGDGTGHFPVSARHPVNPVRIQLSRNYYQVAAADLTGDGIPDLILSDGLLLSIQPGLGNGTFGPEQHLLAGQGINSISLADLRHRGLPDLIVANGGAVLTNPVANLEILGINPDVNTGGITVLLNPNTPAATTPAPTPAGILTASPEPSPFESAITLTSSLGGGSTTFAIDSTFVGTVASTSAPATLTLPTTQTPPIFPGPHTLTAAFTPTGSSAPVLLTGTHTVSLGLTTVTLTPTTPLQSFYGQPADGTFAVAPQDSAYPASGTYTLLDNGQPAGLCTNLPLLSTCPYGNPVFLDAGAHSFAIHFNGDPINGPATSAPAVYIISPDLTTATLSTSLQTATLGQTVTFTSAVTGNVAVPTGPLTLFDGNTPIATLPLTAGQAVFSTAALLPGLHTLHTAYSGTVDFNPATSNTVQVTIVLPSVRLPSLTLLTSSLNPAPLATALTFSATVLVSGPFVQIATGTITFLDGAIPIGTAALDAHAVATLTTSNLALGTHPITASYSGDQPSPSPITAGTLPSVSPTLSQAITQPLANSPIGFQFNIQPVPITIGAGRTAVLLASVTALSGFAQPVALTCSGLPTEVVCLFVQPTIPAGGGSTTLLVTTAAPHDCGDPTHPYFLGRNQPPTAPLYAVALLAGLATLRKRTRRYLRLLALPLALLAGALTLNACGHCTDLGTRPGTYTFNVTATPAGTPVTQSQTQKLQLTVTIP